MDKRVFLIPVLLLLLLECVGQSKDTLHFLNRSVVVGELLKIRLGFVEFDADGIGIIKVKNTKLKTLNAINHSFRLEVIDGRVLHGYLLSSERPGFVAVSSVLESEEVEIQNITSLINYGKTWKTRLTGNVGAGYSYTKSSSIGRLNLNGLAKYTTARTETQLNGDVITTYDSVQVTRDRENLTLSFTYSFVNLWTTGVALNYQRNLELGLKRRIQQGTVIGRKILISRNQQAQLLTGIAFNEEYNLEGVQTKNTEAILQANYNLFSFANPNISIKTVQTGYVSLTLPGRYRLDGNLTLSWEIVSDLSINIQFYHNFDSQSPATGLPNTDYGFVTGLAYKF